LICRVEKKRTLEKSGFVHIAGWVRAKDAPAIVEKIKDAEQGVKEATQNDRS